MPAAKASGARRASSSTHWHGFDETEDIDLDIDDDPSEAALVPGARERRAHSIAASLADSAAAAAAAASTKAGGATKATIPLADRPPLPAKAASIALADAQSSAPSNMPGRRGRGASFGDAAAATTTTPPATALSTHASAAQLHPSPGDAYAPPAVDAASENHEGQM